MNQDAIFTRNYGVITKEEQNKLAQAKITVVGAGGVGGGALINLARMGVGNIQVIDMDVFDYSNINRQMLSTHSRVGKLKAICAQETLLDINPKINITISTEKLVEENVEDFLKGSDVVIDATDDLISRVIIHRAAQKIHVPSVWIAVSPPFRGAVMTFTAATPPYELVLQHPSHNKKLTPEIKQQINEIKKQRASNSVEFGALDDWAQSFVTGNAPWAVVSPVANTVGILASFEAFKIIVNRDTLQPVFAPNLIKIDFTKTEMVKVETSADGSWNNAYL